MNRLSCFLGLFFSFNFSSVDANPPTLPNGFDYLVQIKKKANDFELDLYKVRLVEKRSGQTIANDFILYIEDQVERGQFVACMHIHEKLKILTLLFDHVDKSWMLLKSETDLPHFTPDDDLLKLKMIGDDVEKGEIIYQWIMPFYSGIVLPLRKTADEE